MRSSLKFLLVLQVLLAMTITGSLACKGVMFRLDNVQDYYMSRQQKAIVDVFLQKKVPLTLGVVANFFGVDSDLVNYMKNAVSTSGVQIEAACNGWNYEDFSVLTGEQQTNLLSRCSADINSIFGAAPKTFIPPMGAYNEATKTCMSSTGYSHLSSDADFDSAVHNTTAPLVCNAASWTSDSTNAVYFHGVSSEITFNEIQQAMLKYGYAVVSIHPYEFANWYNGVYDEVNVVSSQITELGNLIDRVKAAAYETNIISSSVTIPVPRTDLNCFFGVVAFRLDDVQDFYMNIQQRAVFDKFNSEGVPITVGVIGNFIGQDVDLVADVQNRAKNSSMFEVACHGWNHEDFTNFTLQQQNDLLANCTNVINNFFQVTPNSFIPPYNAFNSDTYSAMRSKGYTHISSDQDLDSPPYNTTNPYRFPEGAFTSDYDTLGYYAPVSADFTMTQIKDQIAKSGGFSVVMVHPYEYSRCNETACDTSYLNTTQLNELSRLFSLIRQAGYKVVTIGQIQNYLPLIGQNCNGSTNGTTGGSTSGTTSGTTSTAGSTNGNTGYSTGITSGWTSGITSGTSGGIGNLLKGVVLFRLDYVRDHFYSLASISIINLFKQYNIPLSVGLSAGAIGTDAQLTQAIRSNLNTNTNFRLELACGGILAEDYASLSSGRQKQYLNLCSSRINSVYGTWPTAFVPPLGRFNKNTIPALLDSGYEVLSSLTQYDAPPYVDQSSPTSVFRWPANAFTGLMTADGFNPMAAVETLNQITWQIANYGFAVVSVNPMGFASAADSSNVDPAALAELATILETVLSYTDVTSTTLSDLAYVLAALAAQQ